MEQNLTSKKVKFKTENITFRITQSELWDIPYIKSSIAILNNLNSIINNEQLIIQNNLYEVYRKILFYKNLNWKGFIKRINFTI